jgi:uncharacterized protein (TIGR03083 family)
VTDLRPVTITTGPAADGQGEFARAALHSQRPRLASLFEEFDDETWAAPTRCSDWSVHQVVRHLCDLTQNWCGLLRGAAPEMVGMDGFDPRTTPVEWLERSAAIAPADTVRTFNEASREFLDEVERLMAQGSTEGVPLPYGTVPWSIVAIHLFWDAWVHERDIMLPLGRAHASPAIESRAAAVHGLAMTCMPFKLLGTPFEETVVLEGDGGGSFRLEARDDVVTVRADVYPVGDDVLRGALPDVVDSLTGRGPDPSEVLEGAVERIDRLGSFRRFMLTPAG